MDKDMTRHATNMLLARRTELAIELFISANAADGSIDPAGIPEALQACDGLAAQIIEYFGLMPDLLQDERETWAHALLQMAPAGTTMQ